MKMNVLILSFVFTLAFSAPNEEREVNHGSPESMKNGKDACTYASQSQLQWSHVQIN